MLQVTAVSREESESCPIRQVISKVTGKWQLLIILALEDGSLRFGELKRAVGDISQRVLTENLRSLERDGHLVRTVHGGPPLAVSYALTDQGAELINHLKPLVFWAAENFEQVNSARITYDAKK